MGDRENIFIQNDEIIVPEEYLRMTVEELDEEIQRLEQMDVVSRQEVA